MQLVPKLIQHVYTSAVFRHPQDELGRLRRSQDALPKGDQIKRAGWEWKEGGILASQDIQQ